MSYQDKNLACRDCSKEFVWTKGEQEFFAQKGFGAPVRCPDCRRKRKDAKPNTVSDIGQTFEIVCQKCGKRGEVPFKPRNPAGAVLCSECFKQSDLKKD